MKKGNDLLEIWLLRAPGSMMKKGNAIYLKIVVAIGLKVNMMKKAIEFTMKIVMVKSLMKRVKRVELLKKLKSY